MQDISGRRALWDRKDAIVLGISWGNYAESCIIRNLGSHSRRNNYLKTDNRLIRNV
jgi:hypothetical protein